MASRKRKRAKKGAAARPRGGGSKKLRRLNRGLLILVVLGGGLYAYDHTGSEETIRGRVDRIRTYSHQTSSGSHTHREAVIEFEDTRHTLPRADNLTRGQRVLVDVKRGRLSGRPRFVSLRGMAPDEEGASPTN